MVSAVVVNWNGGHRVLRCVRALTQQDLPPAEILVVDSGSSDGSPDRVRAEFPDVSVLSLVENRGPSSARNAGLRAAASDLVLLIDHDIYAERDCLRRLVEAHEAERATVTAPRIVLEPERVVVQADGGEAHFVGTLLLRHGYRAVADAWAERCGIGACPSGCMLVERSPVLGAGGFDEAFVFYFEDLEFSLRLRARGHRLVSEPAAVVYHDRGEGTSGLSFRGRGAYPPRRAYLTMRHRLRIIFTYYHPRTLIVLAPALAAYELVTFAVALRRGWLIEWARAWAWQLEQGAAIWRARQATQRERRVDDRAMLVGGAIPLAPGFVSSPAQAAAAGLLSSLLDAYWRRARRWIG